LRSADGVIDLTVIGGFEAMGFGQPQSKTKYQMDYYREDSS
jgi:hypothetical protein